MERTVAGRIEIRGLLTSGRSDGRGRGMVRRHLRGPEAAARKRRILASLRKVLARGDGRPGGGRRDGQPTRLPSALRRSALGARAAAALEPGAGVEGPAALAHLEVQTRAGEGPRVA